MNSASFLVRRLDFGNHLTYQVLSDWKSITEEYLWVSADVDNGRALWCLEKEIIGEKYHYDGRAIVPRFQPFLFDKKEDLNNAFGVIKLYDFESKFNSNDFGDPPVAINYYRVDTEVCVVTVPSKFMHSEKLHSNLK